MGRKRHKPEEIVAKLRQVDVLASQGQSVAEAIRYGLTRRSEFRRFLNDGRVELDNNSVERAIRPQTITGTIGNSVYGLSG
jgi:hypothetical protein